MTHQLPITYRREWRTVRGDQEAGKRYAYAERTAMLRRWTIEYSTLTDAQRATLQAFYDGQKGGWEEFDFADPDGGGTVAGCRFVSELTWTAAGQDENAVTVVVEEVP